MSIDKMMREMVREEVERAMSAMASVIAELQSQGAVVARLAAALGTPMKRGPGRPPKRLALGAAVKAKGKRGRPRAEARGCAVEGCKRPARSKGYCAAHYQKFRMLSKTGRLPSDWVADAAAGSVKNLVLPRGRAGAKALAESKKRKKKK